MMTNSSRALPAELQHRVAVLIAQELRSRPVLAAHTAAARAQRLSDASLRRNRAGYDDDPRIEAALRFAHAALVTGGNVTDCDRRRLLRAGSTPRSPRSRTNARASRPATSSSRSARTS